MIKRLISLCLVMIISVGMLAINISASDMYYSYSGYPYYNYYNYGIPFNMIGEQNTKHVCNFSIIHTYMSNEFHHWKQCVCGEKSQEGIHKVALQSGDTFCLECGRPISAETARFLMLIRLIELKEYKIKAVECTNGKIVPSGTTKIKYNESQTYQIIPDDGYEIESVKINGEDIGVVKTYTFDKIRKNSEIEVTFKKKEWKNPYKDVSNSDDFYRCIEFVSENKLMTGINASTFGVKQPVSKGTFIGLIGRIFEIDTNNYRGTSFNDVRSGYWYAPYIEWALEAKLITNECDEIQAETRLTTIEALKLLYKLDEEIISKFIDKIEDPELVKDKPLDVNDYILVNNTKYNVSKLDREIVAWALNNPAYILNIKDADGKITLDQELTKADISTLLYNVSNIMKNSKK